MNFVSVNAKMDGATNSDAKGKRLSVWHKAFCVQRVTRGLCMWVPKSCGE